MKDNVFTQPIKKQFEFDKTVASVFDDMICRSVPYYNISQELIISFLSRRLELKNSVIDLGCSTGTLLFKLREKASKLDLNLKGIDNSLAMIERAQRKNSAYGANIDFVLADALEFSFSNVNCVILNYTLQFIRPMLREKFISKIYSSLATNGILILSEKLIFEDKKLTCDINAIYEDYKSSNGYSRTEIALKRKALENVLIPYTQQENEKILKDAGFKCVECIFKWANFAVFIATKN